MVKYTLGDLFSIVFGLPDIVWLQNTILNVQLPKNLTTSINFKIVLNEIETTQAIIFGKEENTRRVYISAETLSFKQKLTFSTGMVQKISSESIEYSVVLQKGLNLNLYLTYYLKSKKC